MEAGGGGGRIRLFLNLHNRAFCEKPPKKAFNSSTIAGIRFFASGATFSLIDLYSRLC
jgi:hypothetical protein